MNLISAAEARALATNAVPSKDDKTLARIDKGIRKASKEGEFYYRSRCIPEPNTIDKLVEFGYNVFVNRSSGIVHISWATKPLEKGPPSGRGSIVRPGFIDPRNSGVPKLSSE